MANTTDKSLLLGTAQWGWSVNRQDAWRILDAWLAAGHRHIDTATNYPINKNPADFRAAEQILLEYIEAHGLRDLRVTVKIGSLNNMRTPEINLTPSFIIMMADEYRRLFGENLEAVMLHWDNRAEADPIRESLLELSRLELEHGLRPGLSGIKHPAVYAQLTAELRMRFDIQLKHNVLQSDLSRYAPFYSSALVNGPEAQQSPAHRLFAYGINAGGAKLDGPYPAGSTFLARGGNPARTAESLEHLQTMLPRWNTAFVRPPVCTMNHLGLIFAGLNPALQGIVLGMRSAEQVEETLDFWRNLDSFDYSDVYAGLSRSVQS